MFVHLAGLLMLAATVNIPTVVDGVFALQSGVARTEGHARLTPQRTSPLDEHIDLWLTRGHSNAVDRYDVDMTKYLHLIAIGDEFDTFLHVHPKLGADHHFTIDMRFPRAGRYHVYADCDPTGIGQQVFRFDVSVGSNQSAVGRHVDATGNTVRAGRYSVKLSTTALRVGTESHIAVHVFEGSVPARDLHPYLGALAHAVFIDSADLSYAHVHPMALGTDSGMSDMPGMAGMSAMPGMPGMNASPMPDSAVSSPDMELHVRVLRRGTYKLWFQFRAADGLHVAPFVLVAT